MTRKELLKFVTKGTKPEDFYYRPGIDDTSRLFLHSIKDNPQHLERKKRFESYTGYKQHY